MIVMRRSVIIYSILFTLITTVCSKSIGFVKNEDVENPTDSRVTPSIRLLHDEDVSDPKLSAKRSLLVLMPTSEEKEEIDCKETEGHSQKRKRCKTPIRAERISPPLSKKEGILRAIQNRLKSTDEIVGASQRNPLTKTDVYDDGKYICYCQQKEDPAAEKENDQTLDSKSQPSPKKIKPEKKFDDRNMLVGRKHKPIPTNVPHRPILPKKSHTSVPQHPTNLRPKINHPILQQKGRERMPYVPYVHRVDPQGKPTKFNLPLNSAAVKPDSIVGQQAPIGQQSDFNEDQQIVGQSQCPSNMLGQTLSQSTENTPRNDQQEATNVYDNNLQSAHSNPSEQATENSIDEEEPFIPEDASQPEDSNVQATEPKSNRQENEYETTGSGVLDYSEIKEVTNAYFTSKAYTDETEDGPTGYDDFRVTGEDQDHNVKLQSPSNTPEEDQASRENTKFGNTDLDGGNNEEKDVVLGESNPESANDGLNQNMEHETEEETGKASPMEETIGSVHEDSAPPDETDASKENGEEYFQNEETIESPEEEVNDEEAEEETSVGSSIDELSYPADSENDYTTEQNDFVNEQATKYSDSKEDSSLVGSSLKTDNAEGTNDESHQSLPFCDNSLLQGTIKSVVNDFANEGSSEETVGSTHKEFLPEIVGIPNLKSVLTMPRIEQTIMEKVKDRMSKIITIDRKIFDSDKMNSMIRNTLSHMLSAAPIPKTELPPMTVEEHQFKDGKWVTNAVTVAPGTDETRAPTSLGKVQASVRSFLRDPAVGLEAAKHPAVQNMIVESVRNTFEPGNEEPVDDSMIRSTLNQELSLMQTENEQNEDDTMTEDTPASDSLDVSNIDMKKLLDIAKDEAGVDDTKEHESSIPKSLNTGNSEVQEDSLNKEDAEKEATDDGVVGMAKDGGSMISNSEEPPEVPNYKSSCSETQSNVADAPRNQESSTDQAENDEDEDKALVGMENVGSNEEQRSFEDVGSEHDLAYLGKISLKNRNDADEVKSLKNSELYYIGDGVKLPLEIRKLNDGSYALSISRRFCEHLLNKECPCCVPVNGNVVRTVRRKSDTNDDDGGIWSSRRKIISDDESTRSILSNERRKRDLTDESLHIFSMPVESFARRYNLSLNLERAQAPWNLDAKNKIDERKRNLKNEEKNKVNADHLRDLLTIHAISDNDQTKRVNNDRKEGATSYEYQMQREEKKSFDRYRRQRNTDENVNKRVEIVKSILNWLKNIILNASPKR